MRLLKTHVLLRLLNSYLVDSPEPANISYLWNFGSLLAVCLGIQILTGAFLAMHYTPNVDLAFNSVEHIMRDVNNGWIIRYTHANVASFFFIFVYMHIARGLYYGSYKSPRVLLWSIGVIILILMMANFIFWPNCKYDVNNLYNFIDYDLIYVSFNFEEGIINKMNISEMLLFNKTRTKAIYRIGPHNKQILDIIICGMLGDFCAEKIPGKKLSSVRFSLEQNITNSAYIHYLTLFLFDLGYCSRPVPSLVEKSDKIIKNRFNYRLSLFTYSNLEWIYDSFYNKELELELELSDQLNLDNTQNKQIKSVPNFISDYLTPIGLSHWIMQKGYFTKGEGISLDTNCFNFTQCEFIANILYFKYKLNTSVVKYHNQNKWRISILKRSIPLLSEIVSPHIIPEMKYIIYGS